MLTANRRKFFGRNTTLYANKKKTNIKNTSLFSHIQCSHVTYEGNYKTKNIPYKQ